MIKLFDDGSEEDSNSPMQRVLPLLLAFVFLQTQSWALSGGPNYGGKGGNVPVGTYGGVLLPAASKDPLVVVDISSIGVFSVGVPQTGLATGAVATFVNGAAYVGSIVASVDPEMQTFQGVVTGTSLFQVTVTTAVGNPPTIVTNTFSIFAQGSIDAKFISTDATLTQNAKAERLIGTATIETFGSIKANGTPNVSSTTTFNVSGLQQSSQVAPSTITLF
jgi:hypothetical protein